MSDATGSTRAYPRVSIVTPSYNQGRFLEGAIQSVLQQDYPNLECIVIDGGSTDGSVDIIRRHSERLSYWVSEKDGGQSEALNKGFAQATGEILGWINSDDMLEPGALRRVAEVLSNPAAESWMVGRSMLIDEHGESLYVRDMTAVDEETFVRWPERWFPQQSTYFTRAMHERVGPIREDLHYCMDLELWIRMYAVSKPTVIPEVLSKYRFHDRAKCIVNEKSRKSELARVLSSTRTLSDAAYAALVEYSEEQYALKRRCGELEEKVARLRNHVVMGRALKWWARYVNKNLEV